MSLVVGLTGGIGSGKSSAAKIFADLGAAVIDTDEIAHRLTQPGQPALSEVREKLGARFFFPDGSLDRALLRKTVFSDPSAKRELEAILHPLIRKEVERGLASVKAPYTLLVVPLLFETGAYDALIQRTLVLDCTEDKQIERATARSGMSVQEARAIISAQVPRALRIAGADDVLDNNGPAKLLSEHVAELHRKYLALA
ncbi:MAG: dephospho-CoA kinase [Burkholderiales bacterium]